MKIFGLVLVVLGALALAYQGFTYVSREKVVDAGPIQITADRERTVWIPPVVGGIAVVAGLIMMVAGNKRGV